MRVDLVWVKLDGYSRDKGDILAIAPAYSFLMAGQEVIIDGGNPALVDRATVIMSNHSVEIDSEEYRKTLETARTNEPLPKVIKRVEYADVKWEGADD